MLHVTAETTTSVAQHFSAAREHEAREPLHGSVIVSKVGFRIRP